MNGQEKHEMVLETTHASGAEEWICPTCGRRLLIKWEPEFKKTILQGGDEFSIHSGGKGGLRLGRAQILPVDDSSPGGEPEPPDEISGLAPWEAWMEERGFEDLWKDEDE